jgi:hypothetical protein
MQAKILIFAVLALAATPGALAGKQCSSGVTLGLTNAATSLVGGIAGSALAAALYHTVECNGRKLMTSALPTCCTNAPTPPSLLL